VPVLKSRWVRAAAIAEIPPGSAKAVAIEGRWFALFHDPDGGFHATDDVCPHEGASLAEGTYYEGRVICPRHNWVFDVRSGECLRTPGVTVACYATRAVFDHVEIELPDGA
jgi:nitrite reductase (NADH) small subunit